MSMHLKPLTPIEGEEQMTDVTKDLLEALKAAQAYVCGPTAWTQEQEDTLVEAMSKAIARAESALAEPKAHHQEPMTIRLDPNALCRNALAREGKPYPKSNCQRCGTLMRPGWKCAEGVELGKPPMRGCELRDDAVGAFKP